MRPLVVYAGNQGFVTIHGMTVRTKSFTPPALVLEKICSYLTDIKYWVNNKHRLTERQKFPVAQVWQREGTHLITMDAATYGWNQPHLAF